MADVILTVLVIVDLWLAIGIVAFTATWTDSFGAWKAVIAEKPHHGPIWNLILLVMILAVWPSWVFD